jgi:TatD DNase family protein
MLIDLHTHQESKNKNSILNIIVGKQSIPDWDPDLYYSIGIHPWYLDSFESNQNVIEKNAAVKAIKAIGECGLDKNSGFSLEQQIEVFEWHIRLAEKLNKPLIIHCIKAFNEIFDLKKQIKSTVPWIIHGFNAPEPIIRQCIQQNFYFSIGHHLFNSKTHIYKLIGIIPRERIFLETDESIIPLEEIYAQYSYITGISEEDVHQMIYANFVHCFKTI